MVGACSSDLSCLSSVSSWRLGAEHDPPTVPHHTIVFIASKRCGRVLQANDVVPSSVLLLATLALLSWMLMVGSPSGVPLSRWSEFCISCTRCCRSGNTRPSRRRVFSEPRGGCGPGANVKLSPRRAVGLGTSPSGGFFGGGAIVAYLPRGRRGVGLGWVRWAGAANGTAHEVMPDVNALWMWLAAGRALIGPLPWFGTFQNRQGWKMRSAVAPPLASFVRLGLPEATTPCDDPCLLPAPVLPRVGVKVERKEGAREGRRAGTLICLPSRAWGSLDFRVAQR